MAARSIRWPPACCRSRSARRPRPSPMPWAGARSIASPCAGARRATPTTPRARSSRPARRGPSRRRSRPPCRAFTGTILQRPPAYSAHQGRRRARLRAGPRRRPPSIWRRGRSRSARLTLIGLPDADHAEFEARSRQGHLYPRPRPRSRPRRSAPVPMSPRCAGSRSGRFTVDAAISLDKLAALGHSAAASGHLLPIETALDDIPALALTEAEAHRLALRPEP